MKSCYNKKKGRQTNKQSIVVGRLYYIVLY